MPSFYWSFSLCLRIFVDSIQGGTSFSYSHGLISEVLITWNSSTFRKRQSSHLSHSLQVSISYIQCTFLWPHAESRDGHVLFHLLALCEIHVVFKCSLDTTISHFKHDYATENTDHQEGKLPSHASVPSASFNILVLCTYPSPSLFWPRRQHIHLFLYSLFFNCAFDTFYSCFYMIMSCKFPCSFLSPSLATHWLQQINIVESTTSSKITATNAEIAP